VKVLDKYIIKSFIGPYIASFLVAEFVLVMQFMWKYIDDFAGRGLTMFDFLELLFFYSITMIPMAVPITILISSVMVYGNLSEKYELSSMKSAGISLIRIMMPGFAIALLTFGFSLSTSNYFKPKAQLTFLKRFSQMKRKKPTLNIQEKIFNKDFHGYAIQVDKKNKDGKHIEKIKMYNLNDINNEKYNIITAKHGEIKTIEDGSFFVFKLFDGYQYVEKIKKKTNNTQKSTHPLMRTHFDTLTKTFDLSEFNKEGSGHIYTKRRDLLNSFQLMAQIDTYKVRIFNKKSKLKPKIIDFINEDFEKSDSDSKVENLILSENKSTKKGINKNIISASKDLVLNHITKKTKKKRNRNKKKRKKRKKKYIQLDSISLNEINTFTETFNVKEQITLIRATQESLDYEKNKISGIVSSIKSDNKFRNYWIFALHQQYSFAIICLIFLFIGAPLGSIISKGGYGFPVLIAIMFFTTFILLNITGDKLNRNMMFNPIFNAWISVIVLFPVSVIITYKALTDSKLGNIKQYFTPITNLFQKKNKQESEAINQ